MPIAAKLWVSALPVYRAWESQYEVCCYLGFRGDQPHYVPFSFLKWNAIPALYRSLPHALGDHVPRGDA